MSHHHKPVAYGALGSTTGHDDAEKVANGSPVVLDAAAKERIKKDSPAPKAFHPEDPPEASTSGVPDLTPQQTRAVIFARVVGLANGKSGVRLQVLEYLNELLNNHVVPSLLGTSGEELLRCLANACHGKGGCLKDGAVVNLEEVLGPLGLVAPGLSRAERAVVVSASAATAGLASLIICGVKRLVAVAELVAALSAEAFGVQARVFDAEVVELQGDKPAVEVAERLRGLLSGSRQLGTCKGATGEQLRSFTEVCKDLGALQAASSSASLAVNAELQAGVLAVKDDLDLNVPSTALTERLITLARLLGRAGSKSLQRARLVGQGLVAELEPLESRARALLEAARQRLAVLQDWDRFADPGVPAAAVTELEVEALQQALALEALAALVSLRLKEGPPTQPERAEEPLAPDGTDAKKDKKKKDRKGQKGMVLGKGTALLRAKLEEVAAQDGLASLSLSEDKSQVTDPMETCLGALTSVLNPKTNELEKLMQDIRTVVEADQAKIDPKVPKGTRDFLPDQMSIREQAMAQITSVFKRHGAVTIDTPVFELKQTLTGKYGEDSKLIYDLADQGGELLSLRYDLTVPFARYVATHGIDKIKRYHIGKVYRRDQPQMNRGRFREFFQCDFDVAGPSAPMMADAEVVTVLVEILTDLQLGDFVVNLNHRGLLDAMMAIAGVPPAKFRPICSAIDKLDKMEWQEVKAEMVEEKGLPEEVADRIGDYVLLKGAPMELLTRLTEDSCPLSSHEGSKAALAELKILFTYLEKFGAIHRVMFNLSLARGLDYYTGVIYEAVLIGAEVGSIAAGGRYDRLVGMFSTKEVPAVGVSIGIERIFSLMEKQVRARAEANGEVIRATKTEVLVACIGKELHAHRMEICSKLWQSGIETELLYKENPKMGDHLKYVFDNGIPYMVVFGQDEWDQGMVKIKDIKANEETPVPLGDLVEELCKKLGRTVP